MKKILFLGLLAVSCGASADGFMSLDSINKTYEQLKNENLQELVGKSLWVKTGGCARIQDTVPTTLRTQFYDSDSPAEIKILDFIEIPDPYSSQVRESLYKVQILGSDTIGYINSRFLKIKERETTETLANDLISYTGGDDFYEMGKLDDFTICFLPDSPKNIYARADAILKEKRLKASNDQNQYQQTMDHYKELGSRPPAKIGMTKAQIKKTRHAEPAHINTSETARGTREQWVYEWVNGTTYIYFEKGRITSIQNY